MAEYSTCKYIQSFDLGRKSRSKKITDKTNNLMYCLNCICHCSDCAPKKNIRQDELKFVFVLKKLLRNARMCLCGRIRSHSLLSMQNQFTERKKKCACIILKPHRHT